eukprot:jgi/Botrbrau1/9169/Bobra.0236s0002.1
MKPADVRSNLCVYEIVPVGQAVILSHVIEFVGWPNPVPRNGSPVCLLQVEACYCIFDLCLRQSHLLFGCRKGRRSCRTCISRVQRVCRGLTDETSTVH